MKIGLFGAAFDPPHLGHLLIARQVLDFADFDGIWFLPTFRHTFAKQSIDFQHRLKMTQKLIVNETQMHISKLEIEHKLDGNTINLTPLLTKLYPKNAFTFIIGSDNLPTFHKWGNWRKLLTLMPFLVFPRAGYPVKPIYTGMNVLQHPLLTVTNISSSTIRSRIRQGLSIDHFVTKPIMKYIQKHKLYL